MKYILIILFFYSCSSSKKIKTELKTVSKIDSVTVQHFDSARVVKEVSSDNKELTIEYDASQTIDTTATLNYDGNTFLSISTKGLKSIRIRQSSNTAKSDSMRSEINTEIATHSERIEDVKTETVKKDSVELPGFNFKLWGIIAGVALPVLIGGFIWWKKRKKKKQ